MLFFALDAIGRAECFCHEFLHGMQVRMFSARDMLPLTRSELHMWCKRPGTPPVEAGAGRSAVSRSAQEAGVFRSSTITREHMYSRLPPRNTTRVTQIPIIPWFRSQSNLREVLIAPLRGLTPSQPRNTLTEAISHVAEPQHRQGRKGNGTRWYLARTCLPPPPAS